MRIHPSDVAAQLKAIDCASRPDLQALFLKCFGARPSFRAHVDLLRSILAHHVQEGAEGALKQSSRRRLRTLAEQFDKGTAPSPQQSRLKPGTRLVRGWHGDTHVVTVLEKAVEYRGKRYGSLSEVATLITGSRWSGPAFFGLKAKPEPKVAPP